MSDQISIVFAKTIHTQLHLIPQARSSRQTGAHTTGAPPTAMRGSIRLQSPVAPEVEPSEGGRLPLVAGQQQQQQFEPKQGASSRQMVLSGPNHEQSQQADGQYLALGRANQLAKSELHLLDKLNNQVANDFAPFQSSARNRPTANTLIAATTSAISSQTSAAQQADNNRAYHHQQQTTFIDSRQLQQQQQHDSQGKQVRELVAQNCIGIVSFCVIIIYLVFYFTKISRVSTRFNA